MKNPNLLKIKGLQGFSLVELLVVITIIVILTGLTIGAMGWVQKKAAVDKTRAQLALLENALEQYHADTGTYPKGTNSLVVYQALFGDGIKADGTFSAPDGKRDDGAKVYLPDLDPTSNPAQMVKVSGTRPTALIDPFGNDWIYSSGQDASKQNNPDFDLSSKGPDGKNRTSSEQADDIRNW